MLRAREARSPRAASQRKKRKWPNGLMRPTPHAGSWGILLHLCRWTGAPPAEEQDYEQDYDWEED